MIQRQLIRAKANLEDTLKLALENDQGAKTSEQFQKLLTHNSSSSINTNPIQVKQETTSSVQQFKNQGNNSHGGAKTVLINVKVRPNLVISAVTRFPSSIAGHVRPEKLLAMHVKRRAISPNFVTPRCVVLTWYIRTIHHPMKSADFF